MNIKGSSFVLPLTLAFAAAVLAGCSDDDNDDDGFAGQATSLLVANDQGSDQGEIERYTTFLGSGGLVGPQQTFDAGLAEGIVLDGAGNLYQNGISDGPGTVRAACSLLSRSDGAMFDTSVDRSLTASLTGPKGADIAQDAGLILVAENGAPDNAVSVFSTTAADADSTVFSIPRSVVGDTGAWDVAYDEATDRLFVALINGDVAYFADYMANATNGPGSILTPPLAPTDIFRPENALAASNMHGIVYVAGDDRLIVSDVADPAVDDDGSVYLFEAASTLSGNVTPDLTLRGPATRLGNPVDLQLRSGDLIVAEKANGGGRILVFSDIATGSGGDVAPDSNSSLPAPESLIAAAAFDITDPDISDLNGQTIDRLFVTSNPGGSGTEVISVDSDLSAAGNSFTAVQAGQFVENVSLDGNGDAVIMADDGGSPGTGGISFINRLVLRANGGAFDAGRDRQIVGAATTLVSPKGVEVVGSQGVALVADLNASAPGAIKAFSLCAAGDTAPLFTTTLPSGVRPWDLDYDPLGDRLFVAATNGTVLVFDDYLDSRPASPDRVIDPDDQSGFAASNIHGIVHDAATDRLILSDVGDAAVADDGRIYVIDNAASTDGLTGLRLEIAGDLTMLGNPVDLAFDGTNLFVAEKSNGQVQRIDDLYALTGSVNAAPSASLAFTAPESIALSPAFLPAP